MPINAHGYFKSGDYLIVGPNWPPETPWSFRTDGPGAVERVEFPGLQGAGVRGNLFQPWFAGPTYWSYNEVEGDAVLELDGVQLATWDHLGTTGVIGHPFILGDLLIFASDQSRTGVATYDISDPSNPVLLDVLTTGGPGGYWPELWGGDGKLYAVFPYRIGGNGFRVAELTDPTDLQFVADVPLPGDEAMYAQFQDEYAFIADHKIDMRTFSSVLFLDGANVVRPSDGGTGVSTSQFVPAAGQPADLRRHRPHSGHGDLGPPGRARHPRTVSGLPHPPGRARQLPHRRPDQPVDPRDPRNVHHRQRHDVHRASPGGSPIDGRLIFSFDDVLTFTPDLPLAPDTTYEVVLPAGGIKDAAGNGIEGYAFTFSTGSDVGGNLPPEVTSLTASSYPVAPAANLTLTAAATDPDTDPIEYRFDFGDGSPAHSMVAPDLRDPCLRSRRPLSGQRPGALRLGRPGHRHPHRDRRHRAGRRVAHRQLAAPL